MRGGDLGANSGFALGHNGEGEADDVDAFFEHRVGKATCERSIPEHDGRNGMCAFKDFKTATGHLVAEKFCVGFQAIAQLGGFVEQVDSFDGAGDD